MDAETCVFLLDVITLALLWFLFFNHLVSNDEGAAYEKFQGIAAPMIFLYWFISSPLRGEYLIPGVLYAGCWGIGLIFAPQNKRPSS